LADKFFRIDEVRRIDVEEIIIGHLKGTGSGKVFVWFWGQFPIHG